MLSKTYAKLSVSSIVIGLLTAHRLSVFVYKTRILLHTMKIKALSNSYTKAIKFKLLGKKYLF